MTDHVLRRFVSEGSMTDEMWADDRAIGFGFDSCAPWDAERETVIVDEVYVLRRQDGVRQIRVFGRARQRMETEL